MKKPREPKRPKKPTKPNQFTTEMQTLSTDYPWSVSDFEGAADYFGVDVSDVSLDIEIEYGYYGGEYIQAYFYTNVERPNQEYEDELKLYKKKMKIYKEKMEKYEEKLEEYLPLEAEYQKCKREKEIKDLKEAAKKLGLEFKTK